MALSKRETAEHIINNPNLSDPVKLKFLNELGPLDEPGAAISQGGSFLSAEDMKPKASSPPTKSAQQDEGTGYGGAILRGLFRTPGLMVAPGLAAAERTITLTPWVRSGAAGAGESLAAAIAAGRTGTIDWGCASETNATATASGITVVALGAAGVRAKYAPAACR